LISLAVWSGELLQIWASEHRRHAVEMFASAIRG